MCDLREQILYSVLIIMLSLMAAAMVMVVSADFGVPGEAGSDQDHLDRPRYVRIADNGSLLITDDNRIAWVEDGSITWSQPGTFCDIELLGTGWAALNGTSSSDCTSILFQNGTTVQLPHRANRIHRTAGGLVVGGMHQNITEVDLAGEVLGTCSYVTGYISDVHLHHYLYDGDLYSYNLTGCSSTMVEAPAADQVYSFHPMPNGTYAYGVGWNNGSRAVTWGNWTSWITSFPEDLDWNGTALAAVDLNHHVVRVWDLLEEPQPDDSDGDGIPDLEDDCPTVWGNATDAPGCPDTDGDGAADHNDPCPNDPADGCIDSDGDGWNDTVDECPGIWGNSTVDRLGCPDDDGDGVSNDNDPCPDDPLDLCGDGDGDGVVDGEDDCPSTWGNSTNDRRGCPDTDGDGWSDDGDDFPTDPTEWVDTDGDGIGDNADVCPGTWGNSTTPPGCPDTDGDGVADSIDPCPDDPLDLCDDPTPVEFQDLDEVPGNRSYWFGFLVDSTDCYGTGGSGNPHIVGGFPEAGGWYRWAFNFTRLEPDTTYDFKFVCYKGPVEGWMNLTRTTLSDPSDGDGDGDGPDGDGDGDPADGDGDGDQPGLLEVSPGGVPLTYLLAGVVVTAVVATAIVIAPKSGPKIAPRLPPAPSLVDIYLEEDEPTDIEEFEPEIPGLPLMPSPDKVFLPEAPSPPVTKAMPYLAIQVAEAGDIPEIIVKLRARVRMEVCEENQKVLDDVQSVEKRLRQLRDDGDIARRKYDQLMREVDDLRRAVQNLTPVMERRDWDV